MEGKFAAMHRTVLLVKKYGQKLPDTTETLFEAAPHRWNSLRTKVSLAKQRLGPRIQSQSDHITKVLLYRHVYVSIFCNLFYFFIIKLFIYFIIYFLFYLFIADKFSLCTNTFRSFI